jgi:hypothetical protein
MNTELAYEQRASMTSKDAGAAGTGILPSGGKAPYRIGQLDWELAEDDDTFIYRHEVDRALVALHPDWGEVIMGRQAIGLGRGVLFGAVDVFSPFSPAEVDREWRRGVDAARVEYRISDTSSAEVLAAFGENWDDSALLGRFRGYIGNIDGELEMPRCMWNLPFLTRRRRILTAACSGTTVSSGRRWQEHHTHLMWETA